MQKTKRVYTFDEGNGKNKKLLGGKGAGLCEMTQIGLPIPAGFVITTDNCIDYYSNGKRFPQSLMADIQKAMKHIESKTGKGFGDEKNPLLVSVRSGSAISMPGMMDTILNLGLNDMTIKGLIAQTKNERFAYDSYRRFISMFSRIALNLEDAPFDETFERIKKKHGAASDTALDVDGLKEVVREFKKLCKKHSSREFPSNVDEQLKLAVKAVFDSWESPRCIAYRREFKITDDIARGTGVSVVEMVFGNMGNDSLTGVAFTRSPETGENELYGEYLVNAQGEDVVAGIRTPKAIAKLAREMPAVHKKLLAVRKTLERHYREVQDFEFTVERGTLYLLQTRNGKMNVQATIKTSVDMVRERIITQKDALMRVDPNALEQLMHRRIDQKAKLRPLATGTGASPGAAYGSVVFTADDAEREGKHGNRVILLREETKPEDVHGFFAAKGILTSRGGKTSHAAVVARAMGKPCVVGCEAIMIDTKKNIAVIGETTVEEGDTLTIDGTTGALYAGKVPMIEPQINADFEQILKWADKVRRLEVRANADTPDEAKIARQFGAQGIGLARTERMFNDVERLPIMQSMILAETTEERIRHLNKLQAMQKKDFKNLLKEMSGMPVVIRLLDPPLHEFLPSVEEISRTINELRNVREMLMVRDKADATIQRYNFSVPKDVSRSPKRSVRDGLSVDMVNELIAEKEALLTRVKELAEVNPMLGHRGVRVGLTYPEIYEAQIRALYEASAELIKRKVKIKPALKIPQVSTVQELRFVKGIADTVKADVEAKHGVKVPIKFGAMIEVVRACLRADRIAGATDFFSFGTNDLTQGTFSFSREDAENKFLPLYNERKILLDNPFQTLDVNGVGRLMKIAVEWGRKAKPELSIGICGEHGGDPRSIEFCDAIGLTYVSCSPYRIPVARLAAARAALLNSS